MIKILQLECISYLIGSSLQAAAILLINEIHETTFLVVNSISYTLLMESTTNLVLVGRINVKMTSKNRMVVRRPPDFEIMNLVELLESYDNFSTGNIR